MSKKSPPSSHPLLAKPSGGWGKTSAAWFVQAHAQAAGLPAEIAQWPHADDARLRDLNPDGTHFTPQRSFEENWAFAEAARLSGGLIHLGGIVAAWMCLIDWHGDEVAMPHIAARLEKGMDPQWFTLIVRLLTTRHSAAALDALLGQLHWLEVRKAAQKQAGLWPVFTLRRLLALRPARNQPAADLLQRLVQEQPEWLAALQAQDLSEDERATLDRLTQGHADDGAPEAGADDLPALLRQPPWAKGAPKVALPVLDLPHDAAALERMPARIDWSAWRGKAVAARARPATVQRHGWADTLNTMLPDAGDGPALLRALGLPDEVLQERLAEVAAMRDVSGVGDASPVPKLLIARLNIDDPAGFEAVKQLVQTRGLACDEQWQALNEAPLVEWMLFAHSEGCRLLTRTLDWQVDEQFGWLCAEDAALRSRSAREHWGVQERALFLLGVDAARVQAVRQSGQVQPGDLAAPDPEAAPGHTHDWLGYLNHLDDALALGLLRLMGVPKTDAHYAHYTYHGHNPAARLLKRFGPEHIALFWGAQPSERSETTQQLMDITDWPALAWRLSEKGFALPSLRAYALRWLSAHPATAARVLLAPAFGADAKAAAHARHHLFALAEAGHGEVLRAEAAALGRETGQDVGAALAQLLATPPEQLLPATLPKLPAWLNLQRLPRLKLKSGHALPVAHMADALMPLMLSKGGAHYAGMDRLAEAVTPESLAALLLGLLQQWIDNAMPAKERWIFELQGRFGGDANARALAPLIRQWRSKLDRVRAYEGLAALTQIGTDTALMLLNEFADQKRHGDLQTRAQAALLQIAENRQLTLDELADRTVPSLGLNERGQLPLDFGARQFTARLGGDLLPEVLDAQGKRLKDLPKPGAKDDAEKAQAASAAWKELKKQARLIAGAQTRRLEAAMCRQRRWTAGDFLAFHARHSVMRSLAQRLLWATFDENNQWQSGFRVAEDGSLADVQDQAWSLPEQARVGLPHPLEIPEAERIAWAQVFADYELMPPFAQLGRDVYRLSDAELALDALPAYAGRTVALGHLLGLLDKGWQRSIGDGGSVQALTRSYGAGTGTRTGMEARAGTEARMEAASERVQPAANTAIVRMELDGQWYIGAPPLASDTAEIAAITVQLQGEQTAQPARWSDLGVVALSELLRELERLKGGG